MKSLVRIRSTMDGSGSVLEKEGSLPHLVSVCQHHEVQTWVFAIVYVHSIFDHESILLRGLMGGSIHDIHTRHTLDGPR
jgi:hypothetical protein